MSRSTRATSRRGAGGMSLLTLGLLMGGFLVFYFGGQAFTPEDAHLIHWGLAGGGAVLGWLIGTLADRLRSDSA